MGRDSNIPTVSNDASCQTDSARQSASVRKEQGLKGGFPNSIYTTVGFLFSLEAGLGVRGHPSTTLRMTELAICTTHNKLEIGQAILEIAIS